MIGAAISGSVMILIVLILRALFLYKLPKWFFRALWILTAIRLLLPFTPTFEVEVAVPREAEKAVVLTDQPEPMAVDSAQAYGKGKTVSASDVLKAVYILGTAVSGGFMIFAYMRMRRLAFTGDVLPYALPGRSGKVTVRSGELYDVPFSCGIFPPVICIPRKMLSFDPHEFDLIIAHEERHIKSGDQLVKWLVAAAVCVNWYNPAAWVMLKFASRDIELACDEAVVKRFGDPGKYALTLISAAESRAEVTVCSFGAPVLDERIKCIMKSKKITICGFIAVGVILTVMTAFFVSISAVEVREENNNDSAVGGGVTEIESTDYKAAEEIGTYLWEYADLESSDLEVDNDAEVTYSVDDEAELVGIELDPIGGIELICPLAEYDRISGAYGEHISPIGTVFFNKGVNVAAEKGTEVRAAADGTVIYAGYDCERGNTVAISHREDYVTYYSHLEAYTCKEGDEVLEGDYIASVGATGSVTGPNLGFSITVDGGYIDPTPLFE